jgi:hypothetical protein
MLLVILLIPILVFLARSIAWLSQTSSFRSVAHRQKIASTYIMEAGVAHAASILEEDSEWTEGFDEEEMTRVSGTYTVTFQDSSRPYQEGNSVNNINGLEALDGPRGPETVVPGTIELIVHAKEGQRQSSGTFLMQAIFTDISDIGLGSGRSIIMEGNVDVKGVENLSSWAPVNAGIHANRYEGREAAISWTPKKDADKAIFTGKVATSSRGDDAISFAGEKDVDYSASEFETGAGRLSIPSPDIKTAVLNKSSAPEPPIDTYGTTRLTSQDYFAGGDTDLQGDLVLDGGALYVKGDLNVNGSITGTGTVYVTGKTTFKGDALIESNDTGVALYSEGAVEITGFNGREFVDGLRKEIPELNRQYAIYAHNMAEASDTTPDATQERQARAAMNAIARVSDIINERLPDGHETGDFIQEQLRGFSSVVGHTMDDGTYGRREMTECNRRVTYGLDRLGTGYFKGLLVSNSYIHTDSAVAVIGSVWASGSNQEDEPVNINGKIIHPGDVYLGDDSAVLLNKDLMDDEDKAKPTDIKKLELQAWIR